MNVLIVVDEPMARERLASWIGQLDGWRVLDGAPGSLEQALALLDELQPDVLLLGVRPAGLDGLQLAARLCERERPPALVLGVRPGELAPGALAEAGIAHLLLPGSAVALAAALAAAQRPGRSQLLALVRPPHAGEAPRSHIGARTRRGVELIPIDEVCCFVADHKYVTLRHSGGEVLLDETLKALEEEFGPRFVRIHRNALVARSRIQRLQRTPLGHFQLHLAGLPEAESLTVSRRHVSGLRRLMQEL